MNKKPVSLLNLIKELFCRYFAARLKKVFQHPILTQKTACVANSCINKSGRLIYDLLYVTEKLKIKVY